MSTEKYKQILFKKEQEEYGENYNSHMFELYKMYVEMADRISSRRQSANSFFLSINTVIVGMVSYVSLSLKSNIFYLVVGIAGVLLCFTWYRLVRSYKDLNTGKFKIIHEIESKLPMAMYDAEWEALGRGENKELYLQFTLVELRVPIIFGLLHFFVAVYSIPWSNLF